MIKYLIFGIFLLDAQLSFLEDINPDMQVGFSNALKYRAERGSTLDLETVDKTKIHFSMETLVGSHVCDLSGVANAGSEKSKSYEFNYEGCDLSLRLSDDGQSVASSDSGDKCGLRVCELSGPFNGLAFKRFR